MCVLAFLMTIEKIGVRSQCLLPLCADENNRDPIIDNKLDNISAICKDRGVPQIEDAACVLGQVFT